MTMVTDPSRFWRQQDIVSSAALAKLRIIGIGAGGIGSHTYRALVKMGVEHLTVYDPDTVELHNLPSQNYRLCDIGKPKVIALAEIIQEETGVVITAIAERFSQQDLPPAIIISAVDSMATRKEIWSRVKYKPSVPFYIEGRMGAQTARIYTFNPCLPQIVSWYEKHMLYSDQEAAELPCTARAIIYNTNMIAAFISHQVAQFSQGKTSPWETVFDFVTMSLLVHPR